MYSNVVKQGLFNEGWWTEESEKVSQICNCNLQNVLVGLKEQDPSFYFETRNKLKVPFKFFVTLS